MADVLNSAWDTLQHIEDTVHTFLTSPVDSPANITTTPSTRNTSFEDNTMKGKEFRGVSTWSGRVCDVWFWVACVLVWTVYQVLQ